MTQPLASGKSARFDLNEIAKSFPPSADTLLLDTYLTNEARAPRSRAMPSRVAYLSVGRDPRSRV